MDSARCKCPHDTEGKRITCHTECAIHGYSDPSPARPYRLSENDRTMLKSFRIATADSDEIQRVREADQNRFNPPRMP